jgi:hypothetical protein
MNTFESKLRPFNTNKNLVSEKIRKLINYLELNVSERSSYLTHQVSLNLEDYPFFLNSRLRGYCKN